MPKGRPGRPVAPLALTSNQEAQLRNVVNVTSLSSGLTLRARIDCAARIRIRRLPKSSACRR